RLLFRRRPAAAPPGDVIEGDLAEPATLAAAVAGSDAVVHLGAATSSGRLDPAVAYRVNVGGASALIAAARAAGCPRIVVMSTQHVHLPRPGLYGVTKRVADRLFLASGLDVTILRPSLVYGPGARGVFVKLAGLVRRLPVIPVIGPGTWHLRPVFLDDLIDLVVATLARPDLAGRTYDVGGPDLVMYNEFLAAICRALGRRCRRVRLPIGVSFVLASVLGEVLRFTAHAYVSEVFGPKQGWFFQKEQAGGGVVANMASHLLFILGWLFGPIRGVTASTRSHFSRVDDSAQVLFTFATG